MAGVHADSRLRADARGDGESAHERSGEPGARANAELELHVLLARVLLAFAVEFDTRSQGSLAMGANVLRVLTEEGVALRDLPALSGVSKNRSRSLWEC